jgi:hypothetical protein
MHAVSLQSESVGYLQCPSVFLQRVAQEVYRVTAQPSLHHVLLAALHIVVSAQYKKKVSSLAFIECPFLVLLPPREQMASFVRIKLVGGGGFVKVDTCAGDDTTDVALRACREYKSWGVDAAQVSLYLVAEGGEEEPSDDAITAVLSKDGHLGAGWPLTRRNIKPGAWLVALKIVKDGASHPSPFPNPQYPNTSTHGAFDRAEGRESHRLDLFSEPRYSLLPPIFLRLVARSLESACSWITVAVLLAGSSLCSPGQRVESSGVHDTRGSGVHFPTDAPRGRADDKCAPLPPRPLTFGMGYVEGGGFPKDE